jgi:hypothetical protein
VGDAGQVGPGSGDQAAHAGPALDRQAVDAGGDPAHRGLDHRAAAGQDVEPLVAGAGAAGDGLGGVGHHVAAEAAGRIQGDRHLGQLGLDDLAPAGQERVEEAELGDAAPLPARPGPVGRGRRRVRVPLEDPHPVPVAREQEAGGEPAHPAADHDHVRHVVPPLGYTYRQHVC